MSSVISLSIWVPFGLFRVAWCLLICRSWKRRFAFLFQSIPIRVDWTSGHQIFRFWGCRFGRNLVLKLFCASNLWVFLLSRWLHLTDIHSSDSTRVCIIFLQKWLEIWWCNYWWMSNFLCPYHNRNLCLIFLGNMTLVFRLSNSKIVQENSMQTCTLSLDLRNCCI